MRVIGIDPGFARCGWCVLEKQNKELLILDSGLIETSTDLAFPFRLNYISKTIKIIIEKHKPDILSIEEIFFAKNVKTAIAISHVRGVIINLAIELNLNVTEYTPLQIKQAITGYGKANKIQIQNMVIKLIKNSKIPNQDDIVDSIAVAICELNTRRINSVKC